MNEHHECLHHEAMVNVDRTICNKIEAEKMERKEQYTTIVDTLGTVNARIDRSTPRWAFLAVLGVLIALMGFQVKTLTSMDKNIAVMAQQLTNQEQALDAHIRNYQRDKFGKGR